MDGHAAARLLPGDVSGDLDPLNTTAWLVLRLCGLQQASEVEMLHAPEELRLILQRVALELGTRRVIDRLFDYTHRVAQHMMTRRRDVVVLDAGRSWDENLAIALAQQYTRYSLVVGETDRETDRVLGYVHLKGIVAVLGSHRRPGTIRDLAREPICAAEETPRVLASAHPSGGEYGCKAGVRRVVTLADLLEEFVGESQDEQDGDEVPPMAREQDGSFAVDGRVTLDVAAGALGLLLSDVPAGVETLDSYVTVQRGELAQPGQSILRGGFRLMVLGMRDGRVQRLRGKPLPETHPRCDGRSRIRGSDIDGATATTAQTAPMESTMGVVCARSASVRWALAHAGGFVLRSAPCWMRSIAARTFSGLVSMSRSASRQINYLWLKIYSL